MNELAVVQNNLPTNAEDLSKFILIGTEKLKAVKAEIAAIDKLELAEEVRKQKLTEAQDISDAVQLASVQVGKIMNAMPKSSGGDHGNQYTGGKIPAERNFAKTKKEAAEKMGLDKNQVSQFQQMAKHEDIVKQALKEAREEGEIPNRALIMGKIKEAKKEAEKEKRQEAIKAQMDAPKSSNHIDIFSTDKKYRVIYADPPWQYNDKQDTAKLGGAVKHYPTMPLEEICAIPIPAEKNAVLFLWTTSPMLEDAFKVINAWGFGYKSSFVWDKIAHAMGHYNSVRHEFLLVCTRGQCTPDVPRLVDSVVSIERTEHSKKPKEFREMIDMLYPVGARLEMFARDASPGWDVWGNMA